MDQIVIDALKRVGNEVSKEREKAFIVSVNYTDGTSLYSTYKNDINFEIAEKLNKGDLYLNYNHKGTLCNIYSVLEKITDEFKNIVLIVNEEERVSCESDD